MTALESKPTKILAVESSRAVRMVIEKAFQEYNCVIIEAANGKEALDYLSKEKPNIILLGTTMLQMNGMETLKCIHRKPQLRGIPIIVITAEATLEMLVSMSQLGIHDFIFKPFKETALVEKVMRSIKLEEKMLETNA